MYYNLNASESYRSGDIYFDPVKKARKKSTTAVIQPNITETLTTRDMHSKKDDALTLSI